MTLLNEQEENISDMLSLPKDEIEINALGGKQSKLGVRMDLLPAKATLSVAQVLHEGANKYGETNWHNISTESHLNHALTHIYKYLANDRTEDHLEHAACRMLMALEIYLREK